MNYFIPYRALPLKTYQHLPFIEKQYSRRSSTDTNLEKETSSLDSGLGKRISFSGNEEIENREELADIIISILRDQEVKLSIVSNLKENQRVLLQTYLQYVVKPISLPQILSGKESSKKLADEDFVDLSKRKDENLKKVISAVLKVIYNEYISKRGSNPNLKKDSNRDETNQMMFQYYFARKPTSVKKGHKNVLEHNMAFSIKEGMTQDWFEAVVGLKYSGPSHKKAEGKFLKKIIETLKSDHLIEFYRRKIESMTRKTLIIGRRNRDTEINYPDSKVHSKVHEKLQCIKKKPKIALSICQFRLAVNFTITTLEKIVRKNGIMYLLYDSNETACTRS